MERNDAWKEKKITAYKNTASFDYGSMPDSSGTGILFVYET